MIHRRRLRLPIDSRGESGQVKSFAPREVIMAKIGVERIDSNVRKTVCAQTGDE